MVNKLSCTDTLQVYRVLVNTGTRDTWGAFTTGLQELIQTQMLPPHAGGLPDLVLWHPGRQEAQLVEVKGPRDRLSDQQLAWMQVLGAAGMQVRWARGSRHLLLLLLCKSCSFLFLDNSEVISNIVDKCLQRLKMFVLFYSWLSGQVACLKEHKDSARTMACRSS